MIEFESLPDELLMEILVRLSADDIYDNARLVCRRWFHLIHTDAFVREHLHRSSSGLLLADRDTENPLILVTATSQGRVEISELSCRFRFPVQCSCNGLFLCWSEDWLTEMNPFIFNPATKCAFNLPRLTVAEVELMYTLAYAAASMAYKVVGLYFKSRSTQCGILTVGVDNSWRHVAVEGLSLEARELLVTYSTPLMTGGFVNWVSDTHVVSLNVETEIFTEISTLLYSFSRGVYISIYSLRRLVVGGLGDETRNMGMEKGALASFTILILM